MFHLRCTVAITTIFLIFIFLCLLDNVISEETTSTLPSTTLDDVRRKGFRTTKSTTKTKVKTTKKSAKWPKPRGGTKKWVGDSSEEDYLKKSTKLMYLMEEEDAGDKSTTATAGTTERLLSLREINPYTVTAYLTELAEKLENYADIQIEVIGKTIQFNDITMMKIEEKKENTKNATFRATDDQFLEDVVEKKIIFIVHGLGVHGTTELPLSFKEYFEIILSFYLHYLHMFDIYVVPVANPDGFAYNMHSNQPWDKNMSPQNECFGVNVDRNFDVHWAPSTKSSCSSQYPGTAPFTEAESKAIRDVFHKYGQKITAYMYLHASSMSSSVLKGDAVLYPKGFTDTQSDDDRYIDLKGEIEEAMRNTSFHYLTVTVDTLYNWYGKVLGTSVDYASTAYGIPYSLELLMQLYEDQLGITTTPFELTYRTISLTELWRRVIDVIFNNIYKNTYGNNNDLR